MHFQREHETSTDRARVTLDAARHRLRLDHERIIIVVTLLFNKQSPRIVANFIKNKCE